MTDLGRHTPQQTPFVRLHVDVLAPFPRIPYRPDMSDEAAPPDAVVTVTLGNDPPLLPADPADLTWTLAFALQYQGRKRVNTAADAMARITADRLVEHLRMSGYVIMRKPAAPLPPSGYKG